MVGTAGGQVVLDGSFGPSGALFGPQYAIPAHIGRQLGPNLFHSFSRFSLQTGEAATFSGPESVHNILARVTGGEPSSIDGLVRSSIPGANLFLLNPAGVMFGPNASVDVSGSFVVSTADYLKLGDDGRLGILHPENTVLTTAPPSAFGFLNGAPAGVTLSGAHLTAAPERSVAIVAGDIEVISSSITAAGGGINIASVRSAGEVVGDMTSRRADPVMNGFAEGGTVDVGGGSRLDVRGEKAGKVVIRGGKLVLEAKPFTQETAVLAESSQADAGGGIHLRLTESVSLNANAKIIARNTSGADGASMDINISAGDALTIDNRSFVTSQTTSHADGADISLKAKTIRVANDSRVTTYAERDGAAGAIRIEAETVDLREGASLRTETEKNSLAAGGTIDIATKTLMVAAVSEIVSITAGEGRGGDISIHAEDVSVLGAKLGGGGFSASRIESNSGHRPLTPLDSVTRGDGGDIRVTTRKLSIESGGVIRSTSYQNGTGGDVDVTAEQIKISAGGVANGGGIQTESRQWFSDNYNNQTSSGSAGNITVQTRSLDISTGGEIASRALNPRGLTGEIDVTAEDIRLSALTGPTLDMAPRGGIITAVANEVSRAYSGGDISISTGTMALDAGAVIKATLTTVNASHTGTMEAGRAPSVTIEARELSVRGDRTEISTRLNLGARAYATGGDLSIIAGKLWVLGGAELGTSAGGGEAVLLGSSHGGALTIVAEELGISGSSSATRPSLVYADGVGLPINGRVQIRASRLRLEDGGRLRVAGSYADRPSGLTLDTDETVITRGGRVETSGTLAENLTLRAHVSLTISDGGQISSETTSYVYDPYPGAIDIESPKIMVVGQGSRIFAQAKNEGTPPQDRQAGGDINIRTRELTLADGGVISGIASFRGDGGSIKIAGMNGESAAHSVRISGLGSGIIADAIESGPSPRAGGDIGVFARRVELHDRARISTSTSTPLRGGKIVLQAEHLRLSDRSTISSSTSSSGAGGDAIVQVGSLRLSGNSSISASSTASGAAGSLSVEAGDRVVLSGGSSISASGVGTGGNIFVSAGNEIRLRHSRVTALAGRDGGNITMLARNGETTTAERLSRIYLYDSLVTAGSNEGNGGNILVDPELVVLNASRITANAEVGNGGGVEVVADFLLQSASSFTASSELGLAGAVIILAPDLDFSGTLLPLNLELLEGEAHLPEHCAKKFSGALSSFIVIGSGGLPLDPSGWLPSF